MLTIKFVINDMNLKSIEEKGPAHIAQVLD